MGRQMKVAEEEQDGALMKEGDGSARHAHKEQDDGNGGFKSGRPIYGEGDVLDGDGTSCT
jgi:hypothetical protein